MADLTDKEITKACARAMGLLPYMNPPELTQHGMVVERLISGGVHSSSQQFFYNPLTDRAQAMELVEFLIANGKLHITDRGLMFHPAIAGGWLDPWLYAFDAKTTLRRAICLCAARVQIEKEKNAND